VDIQRSSEAGLRRWRDAREIAESLGGIEG
jgi:hypothetical protein